MHLAAFLFRHRSTSVPLCAHLVAKPNWLATEGAQEGATIYVTTDGSKLILPIPAPAQQGFMILQSGGIRAVPAGGTSSGGGPAANHAVQVAGGLYVGEEEPVVRVGEIDTQVLGNTAEKANDNSSDE